MNAYDVLIWPDGHRCYRQGSVAVLMDIVICEVGTEGYRAEVEAMRAQAEAFRLRVLPNPDDLVPPYKPMPPAGRRVNPKRGSKQKEIK